MDITNFVKKAINSNEDWRHFDFYDVTKILSIEYIVNYEINEEKIATIQIENEIIGFLLIDYPLFFIEDKYCLQIRMLLQKYYYIEYIVVNSINQKKLSINEALYNEYFSFMDDTNNFSAQDFYFYNIT